MKQREQQAQTEAAEALQFLDESAPGQTAPEQETPATSELMAEQDLVDYDQPYDDDDAYEEDYEDYEDYPLEEDDQTFDLHSGAAATPHGGTAINNMVWLGGLGLALAGVGLMVAWNMAGSIEGIKSLQQLFAGAGLAPIDIVLLGVVLAGLARIRSHLQRYNADMACSSPIRSDTRHSSAVTAHRRWPAAKSRASIRRRGASSTANST